MPRRRNRPFLVLLCVTLAACATRRPPPAAGSPAPRAVTGTLEILSVTPTSGTRVTKDTVIVAELSYTIDGFEPRQFFIMVQAATKNPLMTTGGSFPAGDMPVLTAAAGKLRFSYPLRYLWASSEVQKPFRIWFYLNRNIHPQGSLVVAKSAPLDYDPQ